MMHRRIPRALATLALAALVAPTLPARTSAADAVTAVPSFGEPSVSPDHTEIAFVSGGDVWSVPSVGGVARLLAATGGNARRPLFSPDGKRLAFVSAQPGAAGIYVVTLDGGALRRVTYGDQLPELSAWSADGRDLYFSSSAHNIAYDNDVLRVPAAGGTPMQVVHERYVNAEFGAPSPDGSAVAYMRNGFVQWWRRGHSHMDESEIVVAHPGSGRYDTIAPADAKNRWPMWSTDGRTLYYVSDRSGTDQLWAHDAGGAERRLTSIPPGRIVWPSISRDGRTIAFEHEMRIWTYDTASGGAHELAIVPRGVPESAGQRHVTQTTRFSALSLAPDGRKIAFVARGRVFAAAAQDGGAAQLATVHDGAAYDLPVWAAGSRRIAYVIDRGTEQAIATYEFPDGPEHVITPPGHHDDYPHWSPDGRTLAFVRDGRELHAIDAATHADRIVAHGVLDRRPFGDLGDIAFSPAGDWIAYVDQDREGFANAYVVPAAGGTPRAVTFLPNANGGPLVWSPDGTRLFMVTSQRTENGTIAQVDLVPRTPRFREDTFRGLFQEVPPRPEIPSRTVATPAPSTSPRPASSPSPAASSAPARRVTIDFDGIRDRVTFVRTGLDVVRIAMTPDAKTLVLAANAAGQENLYAFSIDETSDEPPVPKQLTSTPGRKSDVAVAPDGKSVYYLDASRPFTADIGGKGAHPIPVTAELDVDFASEKRVVFDQTWSLLDRWYADPGFHGANWPAVRRTYEPYVLGAHAPGELYRVLSLMLGELNSSHLGVSPAPTGAPRFTTGRIGVDWDAGAYERSGVLRVASVVPLGPAAVARIAPGDVLLAVDGAPVERNADVDALFANRIGKRTELRVAPHGDSAAVRTIVVLPVDGNAEEHLRYLAWVASRRAYVERVSGGRVGYVHLYDMGTDSLAKFFTDLDVQNRAKDAVVVDIRNNEGGFVDPYAVDVLTRREYLSFKSRFGTDPPERTSLGQRVLDRPSALVTNEHSLSDAENMTEAYRQLHAGPVVGEPTAGWIIFTSAASLADGGTVRLPFTRVIAHDGVDMELHPRPVDVRVANPPGFDERGDDPQLAAAVRELLKRVRR
jgi:Tol biopolymer transport system component